MTGKRIPDARRLKNPREAPQSAGEGKPLINEVSQGLMLDNGEEAAGADDVDGLVAVIGVHLTHDAAEVVLDGELRQIQAGGYLLFGQEFPGLAGHT